jgi:branched-chain amino acid transport system substrate-binding protein
VSLRGPLGRRISYARATCARALLFAALATGLAACGRGPIRLGVAGAFSDPVGAPMRLAARLAAEEINANGGVNGRKLELIERDDHDNVDSAIVAALDLYQSDAVAVIGHLFSATTLAAAPVYNGGRDPVVELTPSSSSPDVTTAGAYTFRICPSDLAHGAALARWAHDRLQLARGAVLYLNDAYGRGVRSTFVDEFRRRQGEVVSNDPYLGDSPEVGPYLDRMAKEKRAQFVLVAGNRGEAETILRGMRQRGLEVPVMGADGLEGIEQSGALAEGTYESAAYFATLNTTANRRFVEAWRRKYPQAGDPNQPAAATYDAVYLLRDVIARAGTDRAAVRNALAAVGSSAPAFDGITGRIAFDSAGDVPTRQVYIGLVKNGQVILAGGL